MKKIENVHTIQLSSLAKVCNEIIEKINALEPVELSKNWGRIQPQDVWDLQTGDECWFITGKGWIQKSMFGSASTIARRNKGDLFLTKESAEAELKYRKEKAYFNTEGLFEE